MSEFVFLFRSNEADTRQAMGTPERAQRAIKAWTAWMDDIEARGQLKETGRPLETGGKVVRKKGTTDSPSAVGWCRRPARRGRSCRCGGRW
jgi:hypothetical protein